METQMSARARMRGWIYFSSELILCKRRGCHDKLVPTSQVVSLSSLLFLSLLSAADERRQIQM